MKKVRDFLAMAGLSFAMGAFMCVGFKAMDWIIPSPPKTVTFKVTRS
ncbi:hypothetical protein ACLSSQ_00275 [Azospira sp. APE16]|jgi:hypothetical protein